MNLRLKTALIVGCAAVTLAVMLSLVASSIWRSEFDQLERTHIQEHVERLEMSLAEQSDQLLALGYDWATWDTMYAFAANEPSGLLKDLSDDALNGIHLDVMLINEVIFAPPQVSESRPLHYTGTLEAGDYLLEAMIYGGGDNQVTRGNLDVAFSIPEPDSLLQLSWRERRLVLRDLWRFIVLYKEFNWGRQIAAAALQRLLAPGYPMHRWL